MLWGELWLFELLCAMLWNTLYCLWWSYVACREKCMYIQCSGHVWQKAGKGKGDGGKSSLEQLLHNLSHTFNSCLHSTSCVKSVLHDGTPGWIPSLGCFPARQEKRLHPHKAEQHGRAAASRWGRRSALLQVDIIAKNREIAWQCCWQDAAASFAK